jgi:glycosyltransferase involved in cell wall biosynthesis
LLGLSDCDVGISPTPWQRSTFPAHFRDKIEVIHEGIDTALIAPNDGATFRLPNGCTVSRNDQVVTFVARNLEPLRGYHVFMRALPRILAKLPEAQVIVIGGEDASYGMRPPNGQSWKRLFLDEVAPHIDLDRVHFTGRLPHRRFINALQVSSAHVYLTYPFVLSWSLLEAMSAGCVVIGSDTAPLQDVIDGRNGTLVPFFDIEGIADKVVAAVSRPERYRSMRQRARAFVEDRYDADRVCIPQMQKRIGDLVRGRRRSSTF